MYATEDLHPTHRRWLTASRIPMRFHGRTYEDLQPYADNTVVMETLDAWSQAVKAGRVVQAEGSPACGAGLLLLGQPGHGKTTLSTVVAQDLIRTVPQAMWKPAEGKSPVRPVYFGYYPEILEAAKRAFKDDDEANALVDAMFGRAKTSDNIRVLVIDDIGKEHRTTSGWAENFFDHLLRARYDRGLPTIITSNVPLKSWGSVYGASMESFAHEALTPIGIIAPTGDRRR